MQSSHLVILFLILARSAISIDGHLPVIFWHSAGETCCGAEFDKYSQVIKSQLGNDVYIKTIQIGITTRSDRVRSLTMHPFEQIREACNMIGSDEKLRHGYNGLGFSQGALLLRGLAQICPNPPMKNLISLGGPHQGFYRYPRCGEIYGFQCATIQHFLATRAYGLAQTFFTPASYWHDINDGRYRAESSFLAVINNENEINLDFIGNLKSLKKLVLVKYEDDIGVVPKESTWFGYYDRDEKVIPMEELEIYKSDRLGLKSMKENGKLILLTAPLGHLKLDEAWFIAHIIPLLTEN